ncbi:MAG TPA: glycosyltransferase [Methylomirabilota bacterium]|nr:glycosyltransferase [Methylomirabilota bacterium]
MAPRVRLAGIRRDVAALMGAFDVLALTSLWEGLPRVIPQAMAAGVPIVASAVGGVTEVIEDGLTGLLVPPGAPDVLAGRLRELLLDRRRGQALAARARECAGEFELDEMLRRLDALYRELGGAAGRGAAGR